MSRFMVDIMSVEEKENIINLYCSGKSMIDVAMDLNMTPEMVRKVIVWGRNNNYDCLNNRKIDRSKRYTTVKPQEEVTEEELSTLKYAEDKRKLRPEYIDGKKYNDISDYLWG